MKPKILPIKYTGENIIKKSNNEELSNSLIKSVLNPMNPYRSVKTKKEVAK